MPEEKEMLDVCLKNGAYKASVIDIDNILFDENYVVIVKQINAVALVKTMLVLLL